MKNKKVVSCVTIFFNFSFSLGTTGTFNGLNEYVHSRYERLII